MKSHKLSIIFNLALILLSQFFTLKTKAFFNCENQSCKRNSYSRFTQERKLIQEYKQNFATINNMPGSIWDDQEDQEIDDSSSNSGGSGNSGQSGGSMPQNPGSGGTDQIRACSINLQTISNQNSYIRCQIESAIDKFTKILEQVNRLHRLFENLINIMSLATVCDGNGYTRARYEQDHNILSNIANLERILASMKDLLKQLELVTLDCNNCNDSSAVDNAMANFDAIQRRLNWLNVQFYSELTLIKEKINDFKSIINEIARRYGVTIDEIMLECRVSRLRARVMSALRKLAVTTYRRFSTLSSQIFSTIENIKKQQHGCLPGEINDELIIVCSPHLA